MKKIYLVKKDPNMPPSEDNWIYMNQYQFCRFVETPEGKQRKNNFGQINAVDQEDLLYIVECGESMAKQFRKEIDEHDYLREQEEKNSIYFVPFDTLSSGDDNEAIKPYNKLIASDDDVVAETFKSMDIETLRYAISTLEKDEKELIFNLFLAEQTMSETQYGGIINESQQTISYRKKKVLEKLKSFF